MAAKTKIVEKELTKEKLLKYLTVNDLTPGKIAKMYNTRTSVVNQIIEKYQIDIKMEREKWYNNYSQNKGEKVIRHYKNTYAPGWLAEINA